MKTNAYRHRLALLTMLGAYPTIVLLLTALEGPLSGQPMPVKAAALVPLMVLALSYVVMPTLTRLFAGWLNSERSPAPVSRRLVAAAASVTASSMSATAFARTDASVLAKGVDQPATYTAAHSDYRGHRQLP